MKNEQVILKWTQGHIARTPNDALSTDGLSLYSYKLKIGYTTAEGKKIAYQYKGISNTTTKHINMAVKHCDASFEAPAPEGTWRSR